MSIVVTGASGFIGQALIQAPKLRLGHQVVALSRSPPHRPSEPIEYKICGDLNSSTDISKFLSSTDCVVHLAGLAHIKTPDSPEIEAAHMRVNRDTTQTLANAAAKAGVRRFVFLSSINVNGETTLLNKPFNATDNAKPGNLYGFSKWAAEQTLREIAERTGLEGVIIRPPLVYGPGVKGNFLSLLQWLKRGIPLPLGAIHNQRSFVGIDNLVDLIITCIDHPAAANQTFLVRDDEDLSTTELLQRMGVALNKPARLFPVPSTLLKLGARILGKEKVAQRLLGNLQVDISKTKQVLGWSPSVSVDDSLRKTAEWYVQQG